MESSAAQTYWQSATELMKKGIDHAERQRVAEAKYLFNLAATCIDKAIAVADGETVAVLKERRRRLQAQVDMLQSDPHEFARAVAKRSARVLTRSSSQEISHMQQQPTGTPASSPPPQAAPPASAPATPAPAPAPASAPAVSTPVAAPAPTIGSPPPPGSPMTPHHVTTPSRSERGRALTAINGGGAATSGQANGGDARPSAPAGPLPAVPPPPPRDARPPLPPPSTSLPTPPVSVPLQAAATGAAASPATVAPSSLGPPPPLPPGAATKLSSSSSSASAASSPPAGALPLNALPSPKPESVLHEALRRQAGMAPLGAHQQSPSSSNAQLMVIRQLQQMQMKEIGPPPGPPPPLSEQPQSPPHSPRCPPAGAGDGEQLQQQKGSGEGTPVDLGAAGLQLPYLQEALKASRAPPVRTDLSDLQRSFFDGVLALRRAEDARAANNAMEAVRNYQSAVEGLLRVCSAIDAKNMKKKQVREPEEVVRVCLSKSQSASDEQGPAGQSGRKKSSSDLIAGQFPISSFSASLNAHADVLKSTMESRSTFVTTIDFVNDHVELHERLGGGGSGATIYRCTCHGLTFAAKVLPADNVPAVAEAVLWEIVVVTKIDHPNVVKYLGHDLSKLNQIRLYMEFYTETLMGIIKKRHTADRSLTLAEICNWSFQIAKGLQYLHSQDPPIIHRDLKADNIFVLTDSNDRVQALKIGDFDTAKIIEAAKITYTKNLGTPGYMAPEMCSTTEKGYSDKVDIWSFGMILYEMICMQQPYSGESLQHKYDLQASGTRPTLQLEPARQHELRPLLEIYELCTNASPAARPTAKKLVKKIAEIL